MILDETYQERMMEQFDRMRNVTYRPVWDDLEVYYDGKKVGYIYECELWVIAVDAAKAYLPSNAESLVKSGEPLLLVENNKEAFLQVLFEAIGKELPSQTKKIATLVQKES